MTQRANDIVDSVCARLGVRRESLVGEGRPKSVAEARLLAYLLVRELTRDSLPEIGRLFGGRDHTTILIGVRKAQRRVETDRWLREHYEAIRAEFVGPLQELEWINAEIHRLRARAEALVAAATVAA